MEERLTAVVASWTKLPCSRALTKACATRYNIVEHVAGELGGAAAKRKAPPKRGLRGGKHGDASRIYDDRGKCSRMGRDTKPQDPAAVGYGP